MIHSHYCTSTKSTQLSLGTSYVNPLHSLCVSCKWVTIKSTIRTEESGTSLTANVAELARYSMTGSSRVQRDISVNTCCRPVAQQGVVTRGKKCCSALVNDIPSTLGPLAGMHRSQTATWRFTREHHRLSRQFETDRRTSKAIMT